MSCKAIVKRPHGRPFGANIKMEDSETMVGAIKRLAGEGEMMWQGDWNIKKLNHKGLHVIYAGEATHSTDPRASVSISTISIPVGIIGTLIFFKYIGSRHFDMTDDDVRDVAKLIRGMDIGWEVDVHEDTEEGEAKGWCFI